LTGSIAVRGRLLVLDYAGYVTAQQATRELALSALPDAPVVPFTETAPPRHRVRRGAAVTLYWIADRLQPAR
jgi:hypothetical protein